MLLDYSLQERWERWWTDCILSTGVFEIRSLPNLEVVGELSLMSILRWNFKTNMDKTICSSDHGQIILVNGCELAFLSLLSMKMNSGFRSRCLVFMIK
ncbi:lethal(2) giant larvae protein homolog SRO77 isoform X3 [Prunus yedoensis var. nudiflora]|uniref:Lethal(2) giant larvae protein homolog SRO77 isoform X3 n=1 Tax=Prunus yedoensis var. nudiflora TaxID=2094558 RepID=A0A315AID8_PRUYE|nr:lethal(2) giant larvae protein homolog SRO77 isoform X3 [Prunus yedoensis var. nudiflora]